MYKDVFTQIGLTGNEAIIYEFLLKSGETTAGEIIKNTPLKRGVIYNVLSDLVKKGLVNEKKRDNISHFSPNHPEKLRHFLENREERVKKAKNILEASLPSITSNFNLASNMPGIRMYEGLDGIKKVLDDTLINNSEKLILTFSDVGNYSKYLKKWNEKHYAPKRSELKILEKVIIPINADSKDFMEDYMKNPESQEFTKILFISENLFPSFATEVNIYNNKVSFVTFSDVSHMGVIIENPEIVNTLTSIFSFIWKVGEKHNNNIQSLD
jgi:HTH-type transcriptional regulator, sugar sensing transcriptional regulator